MNSTKHWGANSLTVDSRLNAPIVHQAVTPNPPAHTKRGRDPTIEVTLRGKRPCYMCFIFGVGDASHTPSATYMESAPTVPDIPSTDYCYVEVTNIIALYPHLFRIITPVNADRFELLF